MVFTIFQPIAGALGKAMKKGAKLVLNEEKVIFRKIQKIIQKVRLELDFSKGI